jgi:hypothetical protein
LVGRSYNCDWLAGKTQIALGQMTRRSPVETALALEKLMAVKVSGVKWTETAKVIRRGNAVVLEVMTKAGRLYRSTSFRLTKREAAKLAAELERAARS